MKKYCEGLKKQYDLFMKLDYVQILFIFVCILLLLRKHGLFLLNIVEENSLIFLLTSYR